MTSAYYRTFGNVPCSLLLATPPVCMPLCPAVQPAAHVLHETGVSGITPAEDSRHFCTGNGSVAMRWAWRAQNGYFESLRKKEFYVHSQLASRRQVRCARSEDPAVTQLEAAVERDLHQGQPRELWLLPCHPFGPCTLVSGVSATRGDGWRQ